MVKGLIVVAFILVVLGATYSQANKQLSIAYGECMLELDFQQRLLYSQSDGDVRFLFVQVIGCVDKRKGPLAGLVFDRDEAVDKMEAIYKKGGFKAVTDLLQLSTELEDMQSLMDAENESRAFREGVEGRHHGEVGPSE